MVMFFIVSKIPFSYDTQVFVYLNLYAYASNTFIFPKETRFYENCRSCFVYLIEDNVSIQGNVKMSLGLFLRLADIRINFISFLFQTSFCNQVA